MPRKSIENINSVNQTVGINVRRRRLELGYTQQAVARVIGVSIQQLQKYETCINRLTSGRLEALAELLKVPITYFFQSDGYSSGLNSPGDYRQEKQAMALLRAFNKIQSPRLRKQIVVVLSLISEEMTRNSDTIGSESSIK